MQAGHNALRQGWSRPGWAQGGECWQLDLSAPQLRAVQRLCLGSHSLPVETGRFANTDRQDRCCTSFDSGAVGDEKHVLMECPTTDVVRQRFSCTFDLAAPPCMRQLVWGGDRMMVAIFMLACLGGGGSHWLICSVSVINSLRHEEEEDEEVTMTHDGLLVI